MSGSGRVRVLLGGACEGARLRLGADGVEDGERARGEEDGDLLLDRICEKASEGERRCERRRQRRRWKSNEGVSARTWLKRVEQIDTKLNEVAVGPQRRLQLRLAQVRKREGEKKGVLVRHGRRRVEVKDATEERDEASLRGEEIGLAHLCAKEKGGDGYIRRGGGYTWWLRLRTAFRWSKSEHAS